MKDTLISIISKAKPIAAKAYALSPFAAGACVGYFGHDAIKVAVDAALAAAKLLLKL